MCDFFMATDSREFTGMGLLRILLSGVMPGSGGCQGLLYYADQASLS